MPSSVPRDNISRVKGSTPLGTTIFVVLRALDPILQYYLLAHGLGNGLITKLGGTVLPLGGPEVGFGLSLWSLVLLGMAVGCAIKPIFYVLAISEQEVSVKSALVVGGIKAISTTLNTLLFLTTATSAATGYHGARDSLSSPLLIIGLASYILGMSAETVSEIQRKKFKCDPRNAGHVFTGGLFSLARHINYGGYTIWKSGFALASSGWLWGGVTALWLTLDFNRRGIPALDAYCSKRYGAQWAQFKKKVPWKLYPGIL